ncbi:MAG: stalk domain-containing protein, partial [Bacillota bacterium]|nr:stalk domain-containing protein [Bacillota bacterium]
MVSTKNKIHWLLIITLALFVSYAVFLTPGSASGEIKVILDDQELTFSVMPEIVESRALVPMREIFESLGASVSWDQP